MKKNIIIVILGIAVLILANELRIMSRLAAHEATCVNACVELIESIEDSQVSYYITELPAWSKVDSLLYY